MTACRPPMPTGPHIRHAKLYIAYEARPCHPWLSSSRGSMYDGSGAEGGAVHTSSPHTPCEIQDGFARITLDRPEKRNALSVDMLTSLTDLLGVLERRDDVLALAITGAGGAFCAGADLSSVRQDDGTESARYRELVVGFLESV